MRTPRIGGVAQPERKLRRAAKALDRPFEWAIFIQSQMRTRLIVIYGIGRKNLSGHQKMSAFDAVDGASSAASKWYRMIASKPERFKEVMPGNEMAFEVFKELARTRRRNADTVDPGIGRTRLGQRTLKCVFLIGTRSAHSIRASGLTAAQTVRTHDRTRPMLQQRQKVLAKAPSTHDPKRTSRETLI